MVAKKNVVSLAMLVNRQENIYSLAGNKMRQGNYTFSWRFCYPAKKIEHFLGGLDGQKSKWFISLAGGSQANVYYLRVMLLFTCI